MDLLKPHTLRRTRAEVGQTLNAKTEIQIPVSLTERQADYYRQVLGRFYNALVDPKMHRLSSSRASQAKTICEELRKVSNVGLLRNSTLVFCIDSSRVVHVNL